jgi:hypothetical protein
MRTLAKIALVTLPIVAIVAGGITYAAMTQTPTDLDLSTTKISDGGTYRVTIAPEVADLKVGPIHSWSVTVSKPDGSPVELARLHVDGGMPQHGHGLPTVPEITEYLGEGRYLLEGMKFNMPGWWTITVHVEAPVSDEATFNVML